MLNFYLHEIHLEVELVANLRLRSSKSSFKLAVKSIDPCRFETNLGHVYILMQQNFTSNIRISIKENWHILNYLTHSIDLPNLRFSDMIYFKTHSCQTLITLTSSTLWFVRKMWFFQPQNNFGLKFGQMAIFHVVRQKHVVFRNSE